MDKKERDPEKAAALMQIRNQFTGTASKTQCERLLAALQRYSLTTYEAMRQLDVYHVPARILQLRQQGHEIITHWQTVETESGDKHRVGLYALQRGSARG